MYPVCVICSENLEDGKNDVPDGYPIAISPCYHVFHFYCLKQFFTSVNNVNATTSSNGSGGSSNPGGSTAIRGPCPFCKGLTNLQDAKRLRFSVDETARSKEEEENAELKSKIIDLEVEKDYSTAKLESVISNYAQEKAELLEHFEVERKSLELTGRQKNQDLIKKNIRLVEILGVSQMEKKELQRSFNSLKRTVSKNQKLISKQQDQINGQLEMLKAQQEESDDFVSSLSTIFADDLQECQNVAANKRRLQSGDDEDDDDPANPRPGSSSSDRKCAKLTPQPGVPVKDKTDEDEEDDDEVQIIFQMRNP